MLRYSPSLAALIVLASGCIYQDECTDRAVRMDGECVLLEEETDAGSADAGAFDGGRDAGMSHNDAGAPIDSGADACADGLMACSTGCIDPMSDRRNCGDCGNGCDWDCVDGSCETIDDVEVATLNTCVLMESHRVYCWGDNAAGELGDGSIVDLRAVPGPAASELGPLVDLSMQGVHACVETDSGEMYCWGMNGTGQLGRSSPSSSSTPVLVSAVTSPAQMAAGFAFTCVLEASFTKCWGSNSQHELGDGTTDDSTTPVTVLAPGGSGSISLVDVSAGDHHACGTTFRPGQLYCWGNNTDGLLASGDAMETNDRVVVSGMDDIVQVETGNTHNCARRSSGEVLCWGNNEFGQIGDGTDSGTGVDRRLSPTPVSGLTDAIDIAAGAGHSCAIRDGGQVVCWGKNDVGQLGNGTTDPSNVPVDVPGLDDAVQISIGLGEHSCALRSTGDLVCWGRADYGQLGNGVSGVGEHSATPVTITLP